MYAADERRLLEVDNFMRYINLLTYLLTYHERLRVCRLGVTSCDPFHLSASFAPGLTALLDLAFLDRDLTRIYRISFGPFHTGIFLFRNTSHVTISQCRIRSILRNSLSKYGARRKLHASAVTLLQFSKQNFDIKISTVKDPL